MKEGKLGASPKVVVVHPDGRIEEVTAKLQSLSQSKPVDDFLVSLGVTSDTQFGKIFLAYPGLQIYGRPGHCLMISKYGPSLSKAVGPVDPSF